MVRLRAGKDRRLRAGHPWVYANEVDMSQATRGLPPGSVVRLMAGGQALAVATFNPHTLIAARVLSRSAGTRIDAEFLASRLTRAMSLRERLYPSPFYRLVHAEADGLPGIVADRFDDVAVLQLNSAGADRLTDDMLAAVERVVAPSAIVLRNDFPARETEGIERAVRVAKGQIDGPIPVEENGIRYFADVLAGQKTGWFFDQRDNRRFVAALCRDLHVLDLYCHSGGFSIAAAHHGATSVAAVDSSQPALDLGAKAAAANEKAGLIAFRRDDRFERAQALVDAGERYGVVIADPPAFAKSKKQLGVGSRAYRKLARLAASLVAPGGYLFLASCSHPVDAGTFAQIVRGGVSAAGRTGRILRTAGAAPDHPVHPHLPESAYLKGEVLQLDRPTSPLPVRPGMHLGGGAQWWLNRLRCNAIR